MLLSQSHHVDTLKPLQPHLCNKKTKQKKAELQWEKITPRVQAFPLSYEKESSTSSLMSETHVSNLSGKYPDLEFKVFEAR